MEMGNSAPKDHLISCLMARKIISKGCISRVVRARDIDSETPTLESVHIVNDFLEVYPNDLSAAFVFSLKIWRHYLYGVHGDMFTDHKSLQYVFKKNDINLHQQRWLKILKDYDMSVLYHPSKANIVADAFSRLSMSSVAHVEDGKKKLVHDVHRLDRLGVSLDDSDESGIIVQNGSVSSFVSDVKAKQDLDGLSPKG
ncbi:hypothetical protein MTR67_048662 [Solanum verrucosum]|uniref:Reverse transcriptase RNase H-like domain-containing protein n=1 Tax=Solanum verrucosum TaxID=315347 RepID=A0AAF0ZWP2_SOLVR|nr:hypothetical protein MTR67_048662 [Solanum verrucosum]